MSDAAERVPVACACGVLLNVPVARVGTSIKCPKCQTRFVAVAQTASHADAASPADDEFEVIGVAAGARPPSRRLVAPGNPRTRRRYHDDDDDDDLPPLTAEEVEKLNRLRILKAIAPVVLVAALLIAMVSASNVSTGGKPVSGGERVAIIAVGIAMFGGLGYWMYSRAHGCGMALVVIWSLGLVSDLAQGRVKEKGGVTDLLLSLLVIAAGAFHVWVARQIKAIEEPE
jgi:hypothetical protein